MLLLLSFFCFVMMAWNKCTYKFYFPIDIAINLIQLVKLFSRKNWCYGIGGGGVIRRCIHMKMIVHYLQTLSRDGDTNLGFSITLELRSIPI